MKKTLLLLLLAFNLFSCSSDENKPVLTEASLRINAKTVSNSNLTGKPIKRNTLPASLQNIYVYTQATGLTEIENQFEIVPDETLGAGDNIILRGISLGQTSLRAVARTYNPSEEDVPYINHGFIKDKTSANLVYNELSSYAPFIKYISKPIDPVTIVAGDNAPVTFELVPTIGRAIFIFQLSEELKTLNYSCKLTVRSHGASTNLAFPIFDIYTISGDLVTGTIVEGPGVGDIFNKPTIVYEIFDAVNESKFKGAVSIDVVKGASTDKIYTITSDNIPVENTTQTTFKIDDIITNQLINGGNL